MKMFKDLGLVLLALFAPIQAAVITILVLIVTDMITGIMAAVKRKEPVTSAGLRRTLTKLFIFELILLLGFLCETYLLASFIPLSKIFSSFIALTELKSIIENLNEINGDNLLKSLIDKLGSMNDRKDR